MNEYVQEEEQTLLCIIPPPRLVHVRMKWINLRRKIVRFMGKKSKNLFSFVFINAKLLL